MDPAFFTLLGTLIGGAAGIGGGLLAAWNQERLERKKWARMRADALATEFRTVLQQLTVKLGAVVHSMCWLTWLADEGPTRLTQERIDAYDREMHELMPQVTGLQAVLAAISPAAFSQLAKLIERVILVDWKIGNAGLKFLGGDPTTAQPLAGCYEEAMELHRDLPKAVAAIIAEHLDVK